MNIYHLPTIKRIVAATIISLSIASCGSSEDTSATVASHLERSNAYSKQGQYRAAIIEARNIIKKDPANNLGFEQLAKTLNEVASYRGVVSSLEAAPGPLSTDSLLLMAQAYAHLAKFTSASEALAKYKANKGTNWPVSVDILEAKIAAGQNQSDVAHQLINKVILANPNNPEAENTLTQLYLKEGNFTAALNSNNKTLSHSPSNPEALFLSANLAYQKNDLAKAEEQLTNALIELPETDIMLPIRVATLTQLARVLTEQGRSSEALIYTKLLAEANPESTQASQQFQQALKLLKENELEQAALLLAEINENYPNNEATSIYLGLINLQQGNPEQADAFFAHNIDAESANPQLIQAIVATKLQLQKINEALDILEQALKSNPDNIELQKIYAVTALDSDTRKNKGIVLLEKLIALDPSNAELQATLINHYLNNNKVEIALAKLEHMLKEHPDNIQLTSLYSDALLKEGSKAEAQQAIDALLASRNRDTESLIVAARHSIKLKQQPQANKLLTQALKASPNNIEALSILGGLALSNKESDQASGYFQRFIEAAPNNPIGYRGLLTAMAQQQQTEQGVKKIQQYKKIFQDKTQTPQYVLAEYYLANQQLDIAAKELPQNGKLQQQTDYQRKVTSQVLYQQFKLSVSQKQWPQARKQLMQTIALTPNNETLTAELINLETLQGNNKEAEELIELAKQQFPNNTTITLAEANLLSKNDNNQAAITLLSNAWDNNPDPRIASAMTGLSPANSDERSAWLARWLKLQPQNPTPHFVAASDAQQADNKPLAISHYQQVVAVQENNIAAQNNLAWLYFETKNPKALTHGAIAVKLAPSSPAVLDTYGWIEWHMGDKAKGKAALKKAAELAPDNEEIQEHYQQTR